MNTNPHVGIISDYMDERGNLQMMNFPFFWAKENYVAQNKPGVFRGMHMQHGAHPQAKIVVCLWGSIIDFILDLRPGSPSFKDVFTYHLEGSSKYLYVPAGCAHGYYSPTYSTVYYQMDEVFFPAEYKTINYRSIPAIYDAVPQNGLIISRKDKESPLYMNEKGELCTL